MSGIIIPALAIGGVYLIYEGMTKKKHKKSKRSSSSSSNSRSNSSSSSSPSSSSSSRSRSRSKSDSSYTPASSRSASRKVLKTKRRKTKRRKTKSKQTKKRKVEKRKVEKKRPVYVYYTLGKVRGKKWSYNNLPSNWSLVRKADVNKSTIDYTKMAVFSGPNQNRESMKKYLVKAFDFLRKNQVVKKFKITSSSESI